MKRKIFELMAVFVLTVLVFGGCAAKKQDARNVSEAEDSPEWIASLGNEKNAEQLFVVAGVGQTTAYVSMHEKDANGKWKTIMTTPGCIGKLGLGKTKEGDAKTPVGEFRFNYAFGIADDPGCAIKYHKVTDDDYWSGDVREGYEYNKMVSIKDHPDLDTGSSEHIVDYNKHYQHCLNISYNEEGTPGKGSAIFLHCLGPYKPYTGGCVAIPNSDMVTVMKNVKEDCVVVIDSLKVLSPETWEDWGLEAGTEENIGEDAPASEEQGAKEVISPQPAGGIAAADGSLPAYEYPGPELFYTVLYKYMIDELGKDYSDHQVCIPCPVIINMDESDRSDIRVYGNFWIFNYNRNGTTLENTSGGSYPGCIHLKTTDEGYEVTSMDIVEDGSGFTDSAKKIFGDHYDLFMKDGEDESLREKTRAQIIANYVAANNLDITAYKDYGWEPVTLPEENIDSFYSILD